MKAAFKIAGIAMLVLLAGCLSPKSKESPAVESAESPLTGSPSTEGAAAADQAEVDVDSMPEDPVVDLGNLDEDEPEEIGELDEVEELGDVDSPEAEVAEDEPEADEDGE